MNELGGAGRGAGGGAGAAAGPVMAPAAGEGRRRPRGSSSPPSPAPRGRRQRRGRGPSRRPCPPLAPGPGKAGPGRQLEARRPPQPRRCGGRGRRRGGLPPALRGGSSRLGWGGEAPAPAELRGGMRRAGSLPAGSLPAGRRFPPPCRPQCSRESIMKSLNFAGGGEAGPFTGWRPRGTGFLLPRARRARAPGA